MNAADLYIFYTNITTNAVHLVYYIIANLNIRKILQLLALILAMQTLPLLHTIDIIFRQKQPISIPKAKAMVQVTKHHVDLTGLQRLLRINALESIIVQILGKASRLNAARQHNHRRNFIREPIM